MGWVSTWDLGGGVSIVWGALVVTTVPGPGGGPSLGAGAPPAGGRRVGVGPAVPGHRPTGVFAGDRWGRPAGGGKTPRNPRPLINPPPEPSTPEGGPASTPPAPLWTPCPNSIRIRGLGRHRPRRRTAVRLPKRRLTCPSSRLIKMLNGRQRGSLHK